MHATARAVRAVLTGARSNAWLALVGLGCGLAASVWALYLPAP
jgi:LPXTG-motif cell wall-anchored protein